MTTTENIRENELLEIRKNEVERITKVMSPFLSYDNENKLYCKLAHLTKCAFMLGQFPDSPYLQEGRNSLTEKVKMFFLSFTDVERYVFNRVLRQYTAVDADEAIQEVYSLLWLIDADQHVIRKEIVRDIRALLQTSVAHGNEIPAKTKEPRWEINGVSTW